MIALSCKEAIVTVHRHFILDIYSCNTGLLRYNVRCDLHVHTIHSGMCTLPLLKAICRECYSEPEAVYQTLRHRGMDLVTVSDHDSIDAAEALRGHEDFFVSEEVTCRMPSGTELHVGVYDLTERQHVEIQRRRNDLPRLTAYLNEQQLFYGVNHAFSALTGRRSGEDFDWFDGAFPAVEVRNGHTPERGNRLAERMAEHSGRAALGGSDAHTLRSLGSVSTRVPGARNKAEFLEGLRRGRGQVQGTSGSFWRLTRDVLQIGAALMEEKPASRVLAPLALAIPAVTLVNYLTEALFARYWGSRWERWRGLERGASAGGFRPASGEAGA
jgi:predicted metal-dependent phosphoesterase TrpH